MDCRASKIGPVLLYSFPNVESFDFPIENLECLPKSLLSGSLRVLELGENKRGMKKSQ